MNANNISSEGESEEKIFCENSGSCLALMEELSLNMSLSGVAVIAFISGENTSSWISKMKIVGNMIIDNKNILAIAYSKASEMAQTLKNSGTRKSSPLFGEFGYEGGIILKVNSGYILSVFSGGTSEEDLIVASKGLEMLKRYF